MQLTTNLDLLFAAGTVNLPLFPGVENDADWRDFANFSWPPAAAQVAKQVSFLIEFGVIYATARRVDLNAFVRIYLNPIDLPRPARSFRRQKPNTSRQCINTLRAILELTSTSKENWMAMSVCPPDFFSQTVDDRTLSEIYSALPSPVISNSLLSESAVNKITDILQAMQGLRSTLYSYQERTVARLLQQELYPGDSPDPTYLPLRSDLTTGSTFFFHPPSLSCRRYQQKFSQPRGGILAEELGMGKTIITLALILCTRDDLPVPSQGPSFEIPPIYTTLTYDSFRQCLSSNEYINSGERVPRPLCNGCTPSLKSLALHKVRTTNLPFPTWEGLLPEHIYRVVSDNCPFYFAEQAPVPSSSRYQPVRNIVKTYLTTATLVVVPVMLQQQWMSEIHKHTTDDALRVLHVQSEADIPSVQHLVTNFDVVLMTYDMFAVAVKYRPRTCPCDMRCCPAMLHHIRWKRLVVDEGNICGNSNTELVRQLSALNSERRWIVTGTPTTNLVGGNVGSQDIQSCILPSDSSSQITQPRLWTSRDRNDLNKLCAMISEFLAMAPFHKKEDGSSGVNIFRRDVIDPLCHPKGPRFGSIQVLTSVMTQVIIRHQVEDLIQDVTLFPYKHETVLLDLDQFASKTYNVMQTVIAVNAVDSQRVGPDYLFSPQNVAHLRTLSQNITQSLFWHVDDKVFEIDVATERTKEALRTAVQRRVDPADINLLHAALKYQQDAASDKLWRAMMARDELPYRMVSVPHSLRSHWVAPDYGNPDSLGSSPDFMRPSRLLRLREAILCSPPDLLNHEYLAAIADIDRQKEEDAHILVPTPGTKRTNLAAKTGVSIPNSIAEKSKKVATATMTEINLELNTNSSRGPSIDSEPLPIYATSPPLSFSDVYIGNSGSSKLDFILSEVKQYAPHEKFLIFSALPLSLAHISDALKLIGIPYLEFGFRMSRKQREQVVTTFKTSDEIRILLMELKDGARGLNIPEASRIIFCEPVWTLDVEAQAIKRAHRIGQERPITVKTLAIRGTVEQEIMARRSRQTTSKDIWVDEGMRHVIKNPNFIHHRTIQSDDEIRIPLIPHRGSHTEVDTGLTVDESVAVPARQKRRAVHFGDDTQVETQPRKVRRITVKFTDDKQ